MDVFAGNRSQPQPQGLFLVERRSGRLRTGVRPLNREATPTGQYEVDVLVVDGSAAVKPVTRVTTVS